MIYFPQLKSRAFLGRGCGQGLARVPKRATPTDPRTPVRNCFRNILSAHSKMRPMSGDDLADAAFDGRLDRTAAKRHALCPGPRKLGIDTLADHAALELGIHAAHPPMACWCPGPAGAGTGRNRAPAGRSGSQQGPAGCGPADRPCQNVLSDVAPGSQGPGGVSGRDRSDQRLDPDNVHDPCQIVGQNR